SKDGHPIICHDANLKRVCGKEGYIPDLSLKEIKEAYRLLDGQEVPTLEEALFLNGERVPQVIELKVDDGNQKELVKVVLKTLENIKNK
ncbi:glycerophosphodiester phosphodiesterase, partial [Klebsiella pneumoniae]|nr:glycerophosphodiester phosphodiesterase [Klebsiella pneumoniae]